jgi:hypothetical protein
MLEAVGSSAVSDAIVNMVNQVSAESAATIQAMSSGDAATVSISAEAFAAQAAAGN